MSFKSCFKSSSQSHDVGPLVSARGKKRQSFGSESTELLRGVQLQYLSSSASGPALVVYVATCVANSSVHLSNTKE